MSKTIKHTNVPREIYDLLKGDIDKAEVRNAELTAYIAKTTEKLAEVRSVLKIAEFWRRGFYATAIGLVLVIISHYLFC